MFTSFRGAARSLAPVPALVLALVVVPALVSCSLDRLTLPGGGWQASVAPTLICPGDEVRVSWDMGEGFHEEVTPLRDVLRPGTPPPAGVFVTSEPPMIEPPVEFDEARGERLIRPTVNTSVEIRARDLDEDLGTRSWLVEVLLPERETTIGAVAQGSCMGTTPTRSNLTVGPRSERVQVRGVRNTNSFPIVVTAEAPGMSSVRHSLAPGAYNEVHPATRALAAEPAPGVLLPPPICTATRQVPPRDLTANVHLICTGN